MIERFTPTCVGTTIGGQTAQMISAVHPHVRGDNIHLFAIGALFSGSPPRAWGQRCNRRCFVTRHGSPPRAWGQPAGRSGHSAVRRFTPTCVGTTGLVPKKVSAISVHPHVRGDNDDTVGVSPDSNGSPPRAWGQLGGAINAVLLPRFTPTCVGTTVHACQLDKGIAVHPHVRGDNCARVRRA